MRRIDALLLVVALAACNTDYGGGLSGADAALLTSSDGEVSLADGSRLGYMITSDRYKKWDAARRGWGRGVAARFGALLQPKSPTEKSINRAVAYLEGQAGARQAIERAGISVRDFVLMTVALEQQMLLASGGGRSRDRLPESAPVAAATDTPYRQVDVIRVEIDTASSVDTIRPTRDSASPKRDTVWLKPPARDTARDTTRTDPAPPPSRDSVSRR